MTSHIEFTIDRPGYKYPWVAVVQSVGDAYAWGVYSQGRSVHPRWSGIALTESAARQAARDAVR